MLCELLIIKIQMEEIGHIAIQVKNFDDTLRPSDLDIVEIKEMISEMETFLFPTKTSKSGRPKISYQIKEGSVKHLFSLPVAYVLMFQGIAKEIAKRKSLDFLDVKRARVIERFQKLAEKKNWEIALSDSLSKTETYLTINKNTEYLISSALFVESEFYLYGEIYQEGGKSPNLHIFTKEHGNLTVAATKEQLLDGDRKLYHVFGIKVRGKKSLEDGSLYDLKLDHYIDYNPKFDKKLLDMMIQKASKNLSEIDNVEEFITEVRGGTYD